MAGEILIFDATGSNIDGTDPGTALEVGPQDDLTLREFSAPAPPQTVQYAGSVDTEGGVPASRKHENRVITARILCKTAASLRQLQAKVGKVAREGGTLKWILPNAEVVIFDLLAADSFEPVVDKMMYVRTGAYVEAVVVLPAKPYGRGAEQDLGDNTETTLPVLVFTETGIKGDMPGLGRLVIDNDSANTQSVLWWGIQSRNYSSASTAALFYQAESCALGAGTVATGPAGASGGGSNNTVFYGSLPLLDLSNLGIALCYIGTSSTAQTHTGAFRVIVRAHAPAANSGNVGVRMAWSPIASAIPTIYSDPIYLTYEGTADGAPREDAWLQLDLGEINLPKVRVGSQGWLGTIMAGSTSGSNTDDVSIDWVMLVPIDEGAGTARTGIDGEVSASGSVHVRHDGVYVSRGSYLPALDGYEGDYLLIPPSGLESRTLRVLVKLTAGATSSDLTSAVVADASIDDVSAHLYVTPRYLVVPEP